MGAKKRLSFSFRFRDFVAVDMGSGSQRQLDYSVIVTSIEWSRA
jgi:hypothetical protein